MPTTNPYLEYYEAGAMLNQLNFAMQQALLLPSQKDYEASDILLATLSGRSGDQAAVVVREVRDAWRQYWRSEGHLDELRQANEDCVFEDQLSPGEVCRRLLDADVKPWLERIRGELRPTTDPESKIFDLGGLVDQGVRRDDIYRFLRERPASNSVTDSDDGLPWGKWEPGATSPAENWIADQVRPPGEVPPDASWIESLSRFWAELGLAPPLSEDTYKFAETLRVVVDIRAIVNEIDRAARMAVRRLFVMRHGLSMPLWDVSSRMLRIGEYQKTFDVKATKQMAILSAFETQEWPQRIADPIAHGPNDVPKDKMRGVVYELNKGLGPNCPIQFESDGTGKGICWDHKISA